MSEPLVHKEIEIDAPAAQVWPYIATEAGLRRWWGNEIMLEPKEGGTCTERTVVQGKTVVHEGVVTVYDPPRQLTLAFAPATPLASISAVPEERGWNASMQIAITLNETAGRTRVTVVHQLLRVEPVVGRPLPPGPAATFGPQMRLAPRAGFSSLRPSKYPAAHAPLNLEGQQRWALRLRRLQTAFGTAESREGVSVS